MNGLKIFLPVVLSAVILSGCSLTSALPEGEQLFSGLKKISYTNYEPGHYAEATKVEIENVLATAPNASLFGSSYYRNPFPIKLWIWNAFSQDSSSISRWFVRAFGTKPKLMSEVNPALRASVAQSQLKKYGYFNGKVSYQNVTGHNPKKGKIAYTVDMGHLWTIDTVSYLNFPSFADSLIRFSASKAILHRGSAFSVPDLDSERRRLASLFRNNGYYFYRSGYASYMADTLSTRGKVNLRLLMGDSLDAKVYKKWYVGRIDINFRRDFTDTLRNTFGRRLVFAHFNGKKPPLRFGVVFRNLKLRPGTLYKAENETETEKGLQSTGLFSYYGLQFTPTDSTQNCDTLNMRLDLVFDKPYDLYVEANAKGKTSGRLGPEAVLGFTKRNAFKGGEKLDINLHGSYEFQTGHNAEGSSSGVNSYEVGGDVALVLPRLLTPRNLFQSFRKVDTLRLRRPKQFFYVPTTTIKASSNILNRAGYFRRHVVSGELTYDWWTSGQSHHSFSPLILTYEYMNKQTDKFVSLIADNPYLKISMQDQFVPKMTYTYQYQSAAELRNPITWSAQVSESGNLVTLGYLVGGHKWGERNKKMFKNPYAQFVKLETDFVKYWKLSEYSSLVGHLSAGVVASYGNSQSAPYYEQFYVGGANSIRAFNVRSIGPGKYVPKNSRMSYVEQTGDVKFQANLEYRPRLFGKLYGAVFLDAGNVWGLRNDEARPQGKFQAKNFLRELAYGTGVGLRYDIDLFVIRVDWGIGLHVPYDTGRSGFYNIPTFRDGQSIHLAIGYPF